MKDCSRYPHAPDVLERETEDRGFSRGWGMHFPPTAGYFVDMHGHIQFDGFMLAEEAVRTHLEQAGRLNIRKLAACSPVVTRDADRTRPQGFDVACISGIDELRPYLDLSSNNPSLSVMLFLHYCNPDAELVKRSADLGVCAVKLHNAPLIVDGTEPGCWLDGSWDAVFREIERAGLPVLWHVAQRLAPSPYTGGARNTYWAEGWKKGVLYTNEDLLQVFLKVVEKYRGINFIGAHQLHLGWERLDPLLDCHPNLCIDTSVGCIVQEGDLLYDEDRDFIRDFFIKHSDRILFGTDYSIRDRSDRGGEPYTPDMDTPACHIRFIRQLRLPHEELQRVSHANAERLLSMASDGTLSSPPE